VCGASTCSGVCGTAFVSHDDKKCTVKQSFYFPVFANAILASLNKCK